MAKYNITKKRLYLSGWRTHSQKVRYIRREFCPMCRKNDPPLNSKKFKFNSHIDQSTYYALDDNTAERCKYCKIPFNHNCCYTCGGEIPQSEDRCWYCWSYNRSH